MEHSFIDRYSTVNSVVRRVDPRAKIILALAFIIIVVTTPPQHLIAFLCYGGFLVWVTALAEIPLTFVAGRAALVLPFSALVALGLPFFSGGTRVNFLGITLSINGLWILVGVSMKSFLGAFCVILLISTTPFGLLLTGLRKFRVPSVVVNLLALAYRYIFLLTDEAMRLKRAAIVRGYKPRWLPQAAIVGKMAGTLFVRSYERAERVYAAMLLRGYSGEIFAGEHLKLRAIDALIVVGMFSVLILIRIFGR